MTGDKIQVESITLERAEGPSDLCGIPTKVGSGFEADATLLAWSRTAPKSGGYDKVDFEVLYADGYVYNGRFDMKGDLIEPGSRGMADMRQTLPGHMQGFLFFMAGLYKPDHLSEENYRAFIGRENAGGLPGGLVDFREFLAKYDLGPEAVKPNIDTLKPMEGLTVRQQAAQLYATLDQDQKAGLRFGLYPAELVEQLTAAGVPWQPVMSALSDLAGGR